MPEWRGWLRTEARMWSPALPSCGSTALGWQREQQVQGSTGAILLASLWRPRTFHCLQSLMPMPNCKRGQTSSCMMGRKGYGFGEQLATFSHTFSFLVLGGGKKNHCRDFYWLGNRNVMNKKEKKYIYNTINLKIQPNLIMLNIKGKILW